MTIDAPEDDVTVARGRVQHMLESMNAGELQLLCVRTGIRAEFYPGEIKAVNADGTFTILFDDGDKEPSAIRENVKLVDAPPTAAPAAAPTAPAAAPASVGGLTVGATVEARSLEWTSFYPGKIEGVNADGTFAILFDDGDKDPSVNPKNVRSLAAPAACA